MHLVSVFATNPAIAQAIRCTGADYLLAVKARTHLSAHCRADTRYYISSRRRTAENAAHAVRGHRAIENRRKRAGWDTKHLSAILGVLPC